MVTYQTWFHKSAALDNKIETQIGVRQQQTGGKTDNTKELLVSEGGQQVEPVDLLGQVRKKCQLFQEWVGQQEEEKGSILPMWVPALVQKGNS
jgi:hypothetical protein